MKLKRLLCTVLSLTLLGSVALAADPVDTPLDAQPALPAEYTLDFGGRSLPLRVWGSAVELGEGTVRIQNSNDSDPYREIVLNVTEDTAVVNAVTGEKKQFEDLRLGEVLYAYTSPVMTRSQPPISNAELILCGIPADYAVPTYAEVEGVKTDGAGNWSVLVSGDVVLHLNGESTMTRYDSETVPTPADIVPGMRVLAWYRMAALSMPAQATPDRVVLFPTGYTGYVSVAPEVLRVNGTDVVLDAAEAPRAEDGRLLVPVRALAEALGCTVTWERTGRVTVQREGSVLYALTIGGASAETGEGGLTLAVPAVLREGVTLLPAEDLLRLHGLKLETSAVPF